MIPKKLIVMSGLSVFALGYCTSNCFHGSSSSPASANNQPYSVVIEPEHEHPLEQKKSLEQKISEQGTLSQGSQQQKPLAQASVSQQPLLQQQAQATVNRDYQFQGPLQEQEIMQQGYQHQPSSLQAPLRKPETREQQLLRSIGELQHLYRRKVSQLLPYENALPHSSLQQQPHLLKKMKRATQEYTRSVSKEMHRCYGELKTFLWENLGGGK